MTFSDIAINEPFKDYGGVIYTKISEATAYTSGTASGPNWHWRKSGKYEFAADEEVEEFCRWRMA
jgi:hypothetical protein